MAKALYCFTSDLRIQDNPTLTALMMEADQVAFVYVIDPSWFRPGNYHHASMGPHRWQFVKASLCCLQRQLAEHGHSLTLLVGAPLTVLSDVIVRHQIQRVGIASQVGWDEHQSVATLQSTLPNTTFVRRNNSTLFEPEQLSEVSPNGSFSRFRKLVEGRKLAVTSPCRVWPESWPQSFKVESKYILPFSSLEQYGPQPANPAIFDGGERAAHKHIQGYFCSKAPLSYKQTRNELDGWQTSTKFSPYLACGNVSPRQIWQYLKHFEQDNGANESTYWIGFELLWREYFHWRADVIGLRLFHFKGTAGSAPLTSYWPERFAKWCAGNTPYPLVNACMHQLNQTGYMSNRGRQLVASCLVHELAVDWRYGAAYFQQQLVDHDVAVNWGNWQYIAGVGADPRGGRQFNLAKQADIYDPQGAFTRQWQGEANTLPLDSVDAADWPQHA